MNSDVCGANDGKEIESFSVMTYNVGLMAFGVCGVNFLTNPPYIKERFQHIPQALRSSGADVIALQELYSESHSLEIIHSLSNIYPFCARQSSGNCIQMHNGLILLSKFPVLRSRFHPFQKVTVLETLFGSKGVLESVVAIPGVGTGTGLTLNPRYHTTLALPSSSLILPSLTPLIHSVVVNFLNMHTASASPDPESKSIEEVREAEILEVFALADAAQERGEIPIILGDLNAGPEVSERNYYSFAENSYRDAYYEGKLYERKCRKELRRIQKTQASSVNPSPIITIGNTAFTSSQAPSKSSERTIEVQPNAIYSRVRDFREGFPDLIKDPKDSVREGEEGCSTTDTKHLTDEETDIEYETDTCEEEPEEEDELNFFDESMKFVNRKIHIPDGVKQRLKRVKQKIKHILETVIPSTEDHTDDSLDEVVVSSTEETRSFPSLIPTGSKLTPAAGRGRKKKNRMASSEEEEEKIFKKYFDALSDLHYHQGITWDVLNPLNTVGPHWLSTSLRCDHIFLPEGLMKNWQAVESSVLFSESIVKIEPKKSASGLWSLVDVRQWVACMTREQTGQKEQLLREEIIEWAKRTSRYSSFAPSATSTPTTAGRSGGLGTEEMPLIGEQGERRGGQSVIKAVREKTMDGFTGLLSKWRRRKPFKIFSDGRTTDFGGPVPYQNVEMNEFTEEGEEPEEGGEERSNTVTIKIRDLSDISEVGETGELKDIRDIGHRRDREEYPGESSETREEELTEEIRKLIYLQQMRKKIISNTDRVTISDHYAVIVKVVNKRVLGGYKKARLEKLAGRGLEMVDSQRRALLSPPNASLGSAAHSLLTSFEDSVLGGVVVPDRQDIPLLLLEE